MTGKNYGLVYQPFSIGPMTLKNRVVMPPMATNTADDDGFATQQTLDYYEARARREVGLIIVEVSCIKTPQGKGGVGRFVIDDDKYIPALTKLAEVIHRHGARAALQLQHSGKESICQTITDEVPVAPSVVPATHGGQARELTAEEIHELADLWARAAVRAKEAGFDGVEVHGATNYLLAQFQSSFWNKRTDAYGGDIRNRGRFLVEVLQAIKAAVGPDYPFWPRINVQEFGRQAGLTEDEGRVLAQMAEAAGAYAINVTTFGGGSYGRVPPMGVPKGNMLPLAEGIKRAVRVPVMVTGRMDPELGEAAIREGKTDLICVARSLLADPELPRKYAEGRPEDVVPCIACGHCNDSIRTRSSVQCVVNPALTHERELAITPASQPKKVLVIGGGPAGMEAARVAALRGHKVTLCERDGELGGQLNLAVVPPFKQPLVSLLDYLMTQMQKLGVKVELGKKVTLSSARRLKPEAIIVATGAEAFLPPIPVRGAKPVVQALAVLRGQAEVGDRVVIVGGELVGCETAEYLADQGKKVTVVRRGPDMAIKVRQATRVLLLERLSQKGVTLIPGVSSYDEIDREGLAITKDGQRQMIAADTVIMAAGAKPDTGLVEALKKEFPRVMAVGDSVEPRDIRAAMNEGYQAGLKI
jgi:2,4-dienoyl-CoA reductase-like NADH-dependent reductase (Old Yellow Enzyme family)/thioredoxin reductase